MTDNPNPTKQPDYATEQKKVFDRIRPPEYIPGQDTFQGGYSPRDIEYWKGQYQQQGQEIDPGWLQKQQQGYYDYQMQQKPDSYWENPQNVGRWAALVNNLPDNVQPPTWLDVDTLKAAAQYYQDKNGSTPWYQWGSAVDPTDPARVALRSMAQPVKDDMPIWEQYISQQDEAIKQLTQMQQPAPIEQVKLQDPGLFGAAENYGQDVPLWSQATAAVTSQAGGIGQGVAGGAMAGASFGGLPGAGAGAVAGGLVSVLASEEQKKAADPNYQSPFWVKALETLDILAQGVERGIGVAQQLANDPTGVLANPLAAVEAGQFAYNVTDITKAGELNSGLADIATSLPMIGPAISALRQAEAIKGKQPAQTEVWELGKSKASDIWTAPDGQAPSDYALTTIRNKIAEGEWTPDQAALFVRGKFGIVGETRDLIGHMALDPLNISGVEISGGIKTVAKVEKALGRAGPATEAVIQSFGRGGSLLDDVRFYTQKIKTGMPVADVAKLPTFDKMLAGVTKQGALKDHLDPASARNAVENFFGPNRFSKAVQLQQQSLDGMERLLSLEPTIEGKVRVFMEVAGASPQSVVDAGGQVGKMTLDVGGVRVDADIPKYFTSPEGQGVVMAWKNAVPEVQKLADLMKTAEPKRVLLDDVARMNPDYATKADPGRALMNDLNKGDSKTAALIVERWKQGLAQAGSDATAKQYLDLVNGGQISVAQLLDAAKPFKDSATPFRDADFTLALKDVIGEKIDGFAAEYFGVKPDGRFIRISKLIKTAQSYAVLGLNPTYFMNNAISNLAHLAYDGLLETTTPAGRKNFLSAMYGENLPARLREGMGAAELGGAPKTSAIMDAAKAKGPIQKVQDFLTPKSDTARWITSPAAQLSSWAEGGASEIAMTHGIREYWGQMWDAGKGFDNVRSFDPQLADTLDQFVPGGSRKVEQMIRRGKSRAEIEAEIFKGFDSKSYRDVMAPEDNAIVSAFPDVFDNLEKDISAARTDSDRQAAIMKAQREFIGKVQGEMTRQTDRAVKEMIAAIDIDGPAQAIPAKLSEIMQDYNEFWGKYQSDLGDMWTEANAMTPDKRTAYIDDHMSAFRQAWDAYEMRHAADWAGMAQALGGGERVPVEWLPILDIRAERSKEWNTFFLERETNYRAARAAWQEANAAGDKARSSQVWAEYSQKQNENYAEMTAWEHIINRTFEEMTAEQVQTKQPQFLDSYREWIDSQHAIRLQMMAAENLYRSGKTPDLNAAGMADRYLSQHPELADKWGATIHAAADEVASVTVDPAITARIFAVTRGQPEYTLSGPGRKAAQEAYATIRAEYLNQMRDASNRPAGTLPPQAPLPVDPKAPAPSIYKQARTLTPIYDAFEAAAKELGQDGYFRSKKGTVVASHIAAAIEEQIPGKGKKLTQLTQEELAQAVDGWKKKHTALMEEAKAKAAEKAVAPGEPPAIAVIDRNRTPEFMRADATPALDAYLLARKGDPAQIADLMRAEINKAASEGRPLSFFGDETNRLQMDAFAELATQEGYQLGEWRTTQSGTAQADITKIGETTPAAPEVKPDYEAQTRARVVQAERETSYKLADATGEFAYGRKDLETKLRAIMPDKADALLAVFDSLAENFNPEMTSKEFYERLGWKTGGTFEEGGGLQQQSEYPKTLTALHNVRADKLLEADNLGGMPVPSIAVTKAGNDFSGFGDITMVGNRRMIDPYTDTRNRVFNADIYSDRAPDKVWKAVKTKDAQAIIDSLTERGRFISERNPGFMYGASGYDQLWDAMVNYPSRDRAARAFQEDDLKFQFLKDQGVNIEPVMKADGKIDRYATSDAITAAVDPLNTQYQQWMNAKLDRVFTNPMIEVGGRKVPYSLESLVDAMTRRNPRAKEEGFGGSEGAARARATKELKSIDEMHKAEGSIVTKAELKALKDDPERIALRDYFMEISQYYQYSDNQFIAFDAARDVLGEIMAGPKTESAVRSKLTANGFKDFPPEFVKAAIDYSKKLKDLPTEYFEAKPQRSVKFNEWTGAVIPDDADPRVKEMLDRRKIAYKTYPAGDEAARKAAIGEFQAAPDVLFQDQGTVHGMTTFTASMDALIRAYDSANVSTFAHELIHGITPAMQQADADIIRGEFMRTHPGQAEIPQDWHTRTAELPRQQGEFTAQNVDVYEWVSRSFERYLTEGKAPTSKLREVFKKIKTWMLDIYQKIRGSEIDVPVSDQVYELFGKWMGREPEPTFPTRTTEYRSVAGSLASDLAGTGVRIGQATGTRISENPQWYRDMFDRWSKSGHKLDKEKLIGAIEAVQNGTEADWMKSKGNRIDAQRYLDEIDRMTQGYIDQGDPVALWRAGDKESAFAEFDRINEERQAQGLEPYDVQAAIEATGVQSLNQDMFFEDYSNYLDGLSADPGLMQRNRKAQPGQMSMFQQGEDLPLFSQTAQTAQAETFNPPDVSGQESLFPTGEYLPKIEAKKAPDAAMPEGGLFDAAGKAIEPGAEAAAVPVDVTKAKQAKLFQRTPPITETPAFRQWFGESKVTDESGAPKVVYHATDADFTRFKSRGYSGKNTDANATDNAWAQTSRLGHWFSDHDVTPQTMQSTVYPVYVSIENPYRMNLDFLVNDIERAGSGTALKKQLVSEGYDGIIVSDTELGGESYVAFGPTQIKSAIGNRGTFSKSNPDILMQRNKPAEAPRIPDPIAAQNGTAQSLRQPPTDKAMLEGYLKDVKPMMDRWAKDLKGQRGQTQKIGLAGLPKDAQLQMRRYLGKVYSQMNDVKQGATSWGYAKRDFALLNYSKRSDADTLLSSIFPYQFWYTHSMMNWGLRALEKPTIITNYLRMQQFADREQSREGYPTRLKGKVQIPFPWLPEGAGNNIFIDAAKQVFPFLSFIRPFEQYGEQMNMIQRKTMSAIDYAEKNREISTQEANEARTSRQGPIWEKYYTAADMEVRGDGQNSAFGSTVGAGAASADAMIGPGATRNALDLAFSVMGPSLPISMAYAAGTGRQDTVGLLPAAKFVQQATGLMGINKGKGINVEAPIRQTFGWPEQSKFDDYRLDASIAQLMADGKVTADQAKQALIDRAGPAFEQAQQRVNSMSLTRYLGAPLGLDIFPEGEQKVRELKDEYDLARKQYQAGDGKAISKFFETYPEYDVRNFSFKKPDDRIRSYLISSIWENYNKLNSAERKEVGKENELFKSQFLSSETRSYDSIETQTLAAWAGRMGQKLPAKAASMAPTMAGQKPLVDAKANPLITAYDKEKAAKFPKLEALQAMYYALPQDSIQAKQFAKQHPEIGEYTKWRNAYIAANPSIAEYMTSETSKVYGQPQAVQALYYTFQAQRDQLFPNYNEQQEKYFSITDKAQAKAYLQSTTLGDYWDWRRKYAAMNPTVAPYILSAQTLADALGGGSGGYSDGGGYYPKTSAVNPNVRRTVEEHVKSGVPLSLGIESEVRRMMAKDKATDASPDDYLRRVMGSWPAQAPDETGHPEMLSNAEIQQLPPELIRQLVAHKYNDTPLGSGALAQLDIYRKRFEIRGDVMPDQFVDMYVIPALQ